MRSKKLDRAAGSTGGGLAAGWRRVRSKARPSEQFHRRRAGRGGCVRPKARPRSIHHDRRDVAPVRTNPPTVFFKNFITPAATDTGGQDEMIGRVGGRRNGEDGRAGGSGEEWRAGDNYPALILATKFYLNAISFRINRISTVLQITLATAVVRGRRTFPALLARDAAGTHAPTMTSSCRISDVVVSTYGGDLDIRVEFDDDEFDDDALYCHAVGT